MKYLLIILIALTISACSNVDAPSEGVVRAVADTCLLKGQVVSLQYTGTRVELDCVEP